MAKRRINRDVEVFPDIVRPREADVVRYRKGKPEWTHERLTYKF